MYIASLIALQKIVSSSLVNIKQISLTIYSTGIAVKSNFRRTE